MNRWSPQLTNTNDQLHPSGRFILPTTEDDHIVRLDCMIDKIAKEKIHQHPHVTAETIEKDISQEKDRKIEQEERSNLKIGELAICHVQEKVLINPDTSKIISIATKTKTQTETVHDFKETIIVITLQKEGIFNKSVHKISGTTEIFNDQ